MQLNGGGSLPCRISPAVWLLGFGAMTGFGALFHLVAVVVVVGGVAKLISPDGFVRLLRSLGVPSARSFATATGCLEIAIGIAALVVGGPIAASVLALTYAIFTVVVVMARRAGAESCGCFGAVAAPPSIVHVAVNAVSCMIAGIAAVLGAPSLFDALSGQPLAGLPYLFAVGLGAWLTVVIDTTGAQVVELISQVADLGPTFRENAVAVARTTPPRPGTSSAPTAPTAQNRTAPSGKESARRARAALIEGTH